LVKYSSLKIKYKLNINITLTYNLGTAANDAQQQRAGQIVDNSDNNDNGSDDEDDNEATISAEDQAVAPEDNENASDMEIAWEALEVCSIE